MKALSDLAGVDIKSHNNDPTEIVREVRNWFVETVEPQRVPGATSIWHQFNSFMGDFYNRREQEGFSAEDLSFMPVPEFIGFIRQWVRTEKARDGGGLPRA